MDNRAYHLQYSAHRAVALALKSSKLTRQPCEVCGEEGQAHHDSYYPDRWLDVRWLCPKHHAAWHEKHEPEWPTIFEDHPSEHAGHPDGRSGRPPSPWYWHARRAWYVNFRGKRYRLAQDSEEAVARFRELMRQSSGREVAEKPLQNVAKRANL